MKTVDTKKVMLEHSEAKVALYGTYLAIYLNILSKLQFVQRIFVFDLLCGEGIYENSAKGSPLIALETIKNHYFANNQKCPNMTLWFNDNGPSEIEQGVYKVERVERFCKEIFVPSTVQIEFHREDYDHIQPKALQKVRGTPNAWGLFFIDPYGYKDIRLNDIREILEVHNTEVLLFLPASPMYRFAEKSMRSSFPGSEHLHTFLTDLFGDEVPRFRSVYDFIRQVRDRFRAHLDQSGFFVDTFIIERGHGLVYCLFFFTGHIYGFEKMIEAKWKMDEARGQGHPHQKTMSFFDGIKFSGYDRTLSAFIRGRELCTNQDLYRFGLENGYLPKHTNSILNSWKQDEKLEVFAIDGQVVRGNYLSYKTERLVGFRLIDNESGDKK